MDEKFAELSFWDTYENEISAKLREIDVLARSVKTGISIDSLSEVLDIGSDEIEKIMMNRGIKKLSRLNIYKVLLDSSATVCDFFRREYALGSPLVYTREDIAYIYDIDRDILNRVCDELKIVETTAFFFKDIFTRLPAKNLQGK